MRAATLALTIAVVAGPARADTIFLYAAGSLRGALTDIAKTYEATSANKVQAKFGPSGTFRDKIAGGAKTDVFAFANMEHPQTLHDLGKSGAVVLMRSSRDMDFRRGHRRSDRRSMDGL
jgi:molybdate transport system substrate-binding protein